MSLTIRRRAAVYGFTLTDSKLASGMSLSFLTLLIHYEENSFHIYCASGQRLAR
jgi:hypothetical protein